jgi:hypothetical protein
MPQPAPAPMDSPNTLTINADGTWTPNYITINAGGIAQFDVHYPTTPPGICNIAISVSFSAPPEGGDQDATGGTVKIGS